MSLFILSVEERFLLTFYVTFGTLDLSCYRALTAHVQSMYSTVISYLYGAEKFNRKRPEIVTVLRFLILRVDSSPNCVKELNTIIHTILITSMAHTTYLNYPLTMTSNLTHLFWVPETSETSESKYTLGFLPHIIYVQYCTGNFVQGTRSLIYFACFHKLLTWT